MSTYQELLAQQAALAKQSAELEKQLQEARRAERAGVIAQIKNLLAQNGLTVEDLGLKAGVVAKKSSAAGRSVEPKYRNKDTRRDLHQRQIRSSSRPRTYLEPKRH